MIVGLPGLLLALWVLTLREPERGARDGSPAAAGGKPFAGFIADVTQLVPPFTLIGAARAGPAALARNLAVAAALAVVISVALLGWLLRRTVIAKLLTQGPLALVVATITLSILLQNTLVAVFTPQAVRAPSLVSDRVVHLGSIAFSVRDLVNLAVATLMIVTLQAFLGFTKTGKALRATAQNASVAGILNHGLPTVEGMDKPETVVCVLTGHGLKDPDTALGKAPSVINCKNEIGVVEEAVFG